MIWAVPGAIADLQKTNIHAMDAILRRLVDHRDTHTLAALCRLRRFRLFLRLVRDLPRPVSVLDVGGEQRFWEMMGLAGNPDYRITLFNRARQKVTHRNLSGQKGDAVDLSRFQDGLFDVVFSNSVIEHLGSEERQRCMAAEVQRVGRLYFVQTPNRYFPLEPHFLLPFFQFYPEALQMALIRRFNLGWYSRIPQEQPARRHLHSHSLLAETDLRRLFPEAQIYRERVLGMVKSLVAYSRAE